MRIIGLLAGLALLAALGVACTGPDLDAENAVPTSEVTVDDNKFEAPVIEVVEGTTVTWTWDGNNSHNVVGDGWGSEILKEGTFQETFDTAGVYDYRCTLHGGMKGRVIVIQ